MRKIIHVDMDAFFASVEELDNPAIRGKAVIVCGGLTGRGVVSSAAYEARKFGAKSAMPVFRARKLCPHGIFLEGRMERYIEVSLQLMRILKDFTPLVEPVSVDEAFLDVTEVASARPKDGGFPTSGGLPPKDFAGAEEVGRQIKRRIKEEMDLTASVGVATNKFLAKVASGMKKPDGFMVITEEEKERVLKDLPVSEILGVGRVMEKALQEMGIHTIGQLWPVSLAELVERFGKFGSSLYYLSRGIDDTPVVTEWEPKSVGRSSTFERDIKDLRVIRRQLYDLTEDVVRQLKEMDLRAKTITIKVRYSNFQTITRSITIGTPADLLSTVWHHADILLREKVELKERAVRLVGVSLSNLVQAPAVEQLHLFEEGAGLEEASTEDSKR
ncbi:MAG TPA: DNA polymerase IV [Candidatus Tripitaka californicus]|uniref:DNA polymerase IV n=1 Tax=Candidatus Tripitaka californicus TaxID=3367616 RepID=UPI004026BB46|nr:DNA polymerase IV [Planctomycetota bacterium]